MRHSEMTKKKYYEVRPGFDGLRYVSVYGFLTALASKLDARPQRMFVEIASNIDRHCLSEGQFEKGVIDILRDLCEGMGHTDLMIDVGANIGNHSVGLSKTFKEVHSVEPHPVLFHILQANILRNNRGNITPHNFGLASENTSGELVESMEHHELGRIKGRSVLAPEVFGLDAEAFGKSHEVSLKSASEFVGQFGDKLNKGFIKIDVEGMEQEIVEAIVPLLGKYKPIIGFEWFVKSQPELEEISQNLPGYKFFGIVPHDTGSSLALRSLKILAKGRTYTFEELKPGTPRVDVYPLALLVPDND